MSFVVRLAKQRAKFSAAHFTIFNDGSVERLHGHNYEVSVDLIGARLHNGLLFPFSIGKKLIQDVCDALDERVLLPANQPWVVIEQQEPCISVLVKTPQVEKRYVFPKEDVILLPVDNTSSEQLALYVSQQLEPLIRHQLPVVKEFVVRVSESAGQSVSLSRRL